MQYIYIYFTINLNDHIFDLIEIFEFKIIMWVYDYDCLYDTSICDKISLVALSFLLLLLNFFSLSVNNFLSYYVIMQINY
jgi:hypothetical protein